MHTIQNFVTAIGTKQRLSIIRLQQSSDRGPREYP